MFHGNLPHGNLLHGNLPLLTGRIRAGLRNLSGMVLSNTKQTRDVIASRTRFDDIRGVTLEERARLVLQTRERRADRILSAYRRMAKRFHPDNPGGNRLFFQVVSEAFELLSKGRTAKRPLLADDNLLKRILGRKVQPLVDKQREWEEHERWRRRHFYGEDGELL